MRLPRVLTVLFVLTLSTAVHASQDQQAPPLELTIDASASPSELATDATTPLPELAIDANVSPAPPAVEERLPALANQTATQPQLPAHTGWRALAGDVLGDFKDFPR